MKKENRETLITKVSNFTIQWAKTSWVCETLAIYKRTVNNSLSLSKKK